MAGRLPQGRPLNAEGCPDRDFLTSRGPAARIGVGPESGAPSVGGPAASGAAGEGGRASPHRLGPAPGESGGARPAWAAPAPGGVVLVMSPQLTSCQVGWRESSAGGFRHAELARREVGWIVLRWARITQAGPGPHRPGAVVDPVPVPAPSRPGPRH